MQVRFLQRYVWLINTISQSGGISKDDIDHRWACSSVNDNHESVYPNRSFLRHKEDIAEIFGIEIVYNRRTNLYSIAHTGDVRTGELRRWLLNSFVVSNALIESQQLHERILAEQIPEGQEFVPTIIEAMRTNQVLEVVHTRFGQASQMFTLEPYCLKVFKQRWYVYGRPSNHPDERRIYALDRVVSVRLTSGTFVLPEDFDAEAEFANYYGVFTNREAELVRLRVEKVGAPYMRTLPLHHSQKEVLVTDDYSEFTFWIAPTFDFIQQLRTYGSQLEVLEPEWLRDEMREEARKLLSCYEAGRNSGCANPMKA
ncbi:MAG: WYL domain-containing protein [Paludibacteraceae bacterium]|nr:WYL domain-containing protein [Paludibacteraceae bacterium]